MLDDYERIKQAFKNFEMEEDKDILGNPILKIKIGKWLLTFYFDVDVYKDEANLSNLIVNELNKKALNSFLNNKNMKKGIKKGVKNGRNDRKNS